MTGQYVTQKIRKEERQNIKIKLVKIYRRAPYRFVLNYKSFKTETTAPL